MSLVSFRASGGQPPEGYSQADVNACKALVDEMVVKLRDAPGHVALSSVLTVYQELTRDYGPGARLRAGQHLLNLGALIVNAVIDAGGLQVAADPHAIAQQINNVVADKAHEPALTALLMVFQSVALKFPCCTESAAASATQLATNLAARAAIASHGAKLH